MPLVLPLRESLQRVIPNFAYEVLDLQMRIETQQALNINISDISKLMQLYMIGVEVLESKADQRFSYFYRKIQSLMLKKPIVQQLHKASGSRVKESIINEINKAQLQTKKNEYEMQIFFNQGQYDNKKMREIIRSAQTKLQKFEGKIKRDIKKQQSNLEDRLQQRRMRSQASSSCKKIKLGKQNQSPNKLKQQDSLVDPRMEYFNVDEAPNKRKGSAQKTVKTKKDYSYQ